MSTPQAVPAQPVVWHEGLFLAPQHFQHAERHQCWQLQRLARALDAQAWGLSLLAIDRQALASGVVALVAAEGIMPDGLAFCIDGDAATPPSRRVELPPDADRLDLYLAIAGERGAALASSADGLVDGRPTRWRRVLRSVRDDHGGGTREVPVGAANLRLIVDGEALDDQVWIKIAELGRAPAGGLALLDTYAPPSLTVAASPELRGCCRRIAELVGARATELAAQRRARARGQPEIASSEVAAYFTLHALSAHLPALSRLAVVGESHPREAHAELARLAGALCALSLERSAKDLPGYRHEDPLPGFAQLEEMIRAQLEAASSTRCVALAARRTEERVVAATLPDHALDETRLYLAIQSDLPAERLLRDLPLKAKVAALGRLDALVAQALRGLRLAFLSVPPAEIPARPGWLYFEIAREGEEWRAAREARSLAVSLPIEAAGASVEFLAVRS